MFNSLKNSKIREIVEKNIHSALNSNEKHFEKAGKDTGDFSRREFLKKAGAMGLGAGTVAFLPSAAAFNIKTSNPLQYYGGGSSQPDFSVSSSGLVEASSMNISGETRIESRSSDPNNPQDRRIWLRNDVNEIRLQLNGSRYKSGLTEVQLQEIIDDFESGDLTGWYGATGSYGATTNKPYEGSYSLELTTSNTSSFSLVAHPNESESLNAYPDRGNTVSGYYYYGHSDHRCSFIFGIENYTKSDTTSTIADDGYRFDMKSSSGEIVLRDASDGTQLDQTATSVPDNQWFKFVIDFGNTSNDTITCSIEDTNGNSIASVSATDSTYSGRGIEVKHNVDNSSSADFWVDRLQIDG